MYPNKSMTFGLIDRPSGEARAYVHSDLSTKVADRAVVNDTFANKPVVIVFEKSSALALAFEAVDNDGNPLSFDAGSFTP